MKKPDRFESVVAEAPSAAETPAVAKAAAKLELAGDEIIQFTIKPSAWFIPIVSAKWVITAAIAGIALAITMRHGWNMQGIIALQVIIAAAVVRVGIAALQWASKLYVLTNRRVMRFRGVINVDVVSSPLNKISAADLRVAWYEKPLGLGSIDILPATGKQQVFHWVHLARPVEIHERLLRAIRQAQSGSGE